LAVSSDPLRFDDNLPQRRSVVDRRTYRSKRDSAAMTALLVCCAGAGSAFVDTSPQSSQSLR